MLGALRSKKNNPVVVILLGFVIVLMAGFGVTVSGLSDNRWAARVNGEEVSFEEFQRAYQQAFRARQQSDRSFDRNRAEAEQLKQQVLDQLIGQRLLAQAADERGIEVSDEALKAQLLEIPAFQRDGRFDPDLYERALRGSGTSPIAFEADLREQLAADQLGTVVRGAGPSEDEIKARWTEEQTKVELAFVKVPFDGFEDQVGTVTEADVEAWEKETTDPKAAIADFYKRNKAKRYDVPKKVCARHILVKSPKEAPPDLREKHEAKIAEAAKKVTDGEMSFEEAAKAYSDDPSASKGGDLGCFGPGEMVPAFEKAAYDLKKGEMSHRVDTVFGFHIIKVYDIKEPVRKKLEDVEPAIRRELAETTKAKQLAKARADEVLKLADAKGGLEAAIAEMFPPIPTSTTSSIAAPAPEPVAGPRLVVENTPPFPRTQKYVAKIGMADVLGSTPWKLSEKDPRPEAPIEGSDGWLVIERTALQTPKAEDYETARAMIAYRMMATKQGALYKRFVDELKANGKVEVNPDAVSYDEELQRRLFDR